MAKKKNLSNTDYHFNMDLEMEIAHQSKTKKQRQDADSYYNDNISRAAVGRLFNDDVVINGDEPSYVAGYDDTETDVYGGEEESQVQNQALGEYAAFEEEDDSEAYEDDAGDFDEMTEQDLSYMTDEEYMDYIDSMSRSAKNEQPKTLVQPETVRQAAIREETVRQRQAAAASRYHQRTMAVTEAREYDDEEYGADGYRSDSPGGLLRNVKWAAAIGGVVALLILAFFVVQLNVANAKLTETEKKLTEASKAQEENQRLTIENEGLTQQISALNTENESLRQQLEDQLSDESGGESTVPESGDLSSQSQGSASSSAQGSVASTPTAGARYVVKKGDTFWKIAAAAYNDGTRYKEIMSANGITDESALAAGQEIMIP